MSITERIRYGAAELKGAYNRNLAMALAISVAVHVAAIGLFISSMDVAEAGRVTKSDTTGGPRIVLHEYETGPVLQPLPTPRSGGSDVSGGGAPTQSRTTFGNFVASDEPSTDKPIATTSELQHVGGNHGEFSDTSNGSGGDGSGNGGDPSGDPQGVPNANSTPPTSTEPLDATTVFYNDVVLPDVDMADITARVEYPRMAREHGIEGSVVVKALIGVDGVPERVEVITSDNRIFDRAALEAVGSARFSPGSQNDVPVRVWIQIPIRFELK